MSVSNLQFKTPLVLFRMRTYEFLKLMVLIAAKAVNVLLILGKPP